MSSPLPVFQSEIFKEQLKGIPRKDRGDILYNLRHMNIEDVKRRTYLKAELKHFKKYRIGDYRILFSYCAECYNKYRKEFNCSICDETFLERIVIHLIDKRPKLYKRMRR